MYFSNSIPRTQRRAGLKFDVNERRRPRHSGHVEAPVHLNGLAIDETGGGAAKEPDD